MVNGLFLGATLAPVIVAGLVPLRLRRDSPLLRGLPLFASVAVTLCLAGLLLFVGEAPTVALTWLPGMGEMTFAMERNGLLAALATALALTGVFMASQRENPWLLGLMLLALAAANVAFLSAHFLARYVALEAVGLVVALAALVGAGAMPGLRRGGLVYLLLRVGDVGLLAAILLLHARTGTLEISPALAAAPNLSPRAFNWITMGLVLAVAVKVGLWPFQVWIRAGQILPRPVHLWLYTTVMPNLGLYLLYRIAPLAALPGPLNTGLLWLSAVTGMVALGLVLLRPRLKASPIHVLAAQGSLALILAAGGAGKALPWAIIILTAARGILLPAAQSAEGRRRFTPVAGGALALFWIWALVTYRLTSLPLWSGLALVVLMVLWVVRASLNHEEQPSSAWLQRAWIFDFDAALLRFARRLHQVIEVGVLERVLEGLAKGLMAFAQTVYEKIEVGILDRGITESASGLLEASDTLYRRVEMGLLERGVSGSASNALEVSEAAYQSVEQRGLEGSLHSLVDAVRLGSRWLRRLHVGRLRTNLVWVTLALVVLVAMALLSG